MARYYVNKNAQSKGDHEVHVHACCRLPIPENREYLGNYDRCKEAVMKAKTLYPKADGCHFCCPDCDKS